MTGRLTNKIAVVTGSGAGIGKGCAIKFAEQGATVFAIDTNTTALNKTVEQIEQSGNQVHAYPGYDLTKENDVLGLAEQIGAKAGRVDILLNAAAYAVFAWIEDLSLADWKKTLECELDIVFLITKALWPQLKKSGRASVINFASVNAYHTLDGSAALAHCAGKGGVLAMTRQLAMEGAPYGIRANTIAPGFILTEATARHMQDVPELKDKVLSKNMLKRLGKPEDIAWLATYLGSDESTYVTGADFSIDAGATAW